MVPGCLPVRIICDFALDLSFREAGASHRAQPDLARTLHAAPARLRED
jgi:hypothetical protein